MSPTGVRVRRGDELRLTYACSKAPDQVIARFDVEYDNGLRGQIKATQNNQSKAFAADRTADTIIGTRADYDGTIVTGLVGGGGGNKRAAFFVTADMFRHDEATGQLCRGYLYELHILPLGVHEDSGPPAMGNVRDLAVAAADVVAAGVANAVPANALWRIHTWRYVYTATAAVGTRTIRVQIRSPNGDVKWSMDDDVSITASQIAVIQLSRRWGAGYDTSTIPGANSSRHQLIPFDLLPEGYDLFLDDAADIDVTTPFDTVTVEAIVEEWIHLGPAVA